MRTSVATLPRTRGTPKLAPVLWIGWIALVTLWPAQSLARPNIVLILSDDHHWRDYSFTGENPYVATPNIDQLAAEGLLIQRTYVPTSVCRPSILTLFTGLHAVTTGTTGNQPAATGSPARDLLAQEILRRNVAYRATLPRILREYGYRSLQTGKWWEGDYQRAGFDQGLTYDRHESLGNSFARSVGRRGLGPIEAFVAHAVEDGVPFFVSFAPQLPHVPHSPPLRFVKRYNELVAGGELTRNQANYYASIDWLDGAVGDLRELFRSTRDANGRPLEDDTLFVYAVDNGWAPVLLGQQPPLGAADAKRTPSESGVRGPLILYWKDRVFDARSIEQKLGDTRLASTVDVLPTLLALIGADSHRPVLAQGIDLLSESRNEVFGDTYEVEIPVASEGRFVYDDRETARTSRWLIEGRFKLILPDGDHYGGEAHLYDVIADPSESEDLAAQQPDRVARMTARLGVWWDASKPTQLVAHEFGEHGDVPSLDGTPPHIVSGDRPVAWGTSGAFAPDGSIGRAGRAWLPFAPEAGKRYELRAAGSGFALGFFSGDPAAAFAVPGVGWARSQDADGGALTVVLDTRDRDAEREGDQWAFELRVGGLLRSTQIFTRGDPDLRYIVVAADVSDEPAAAAAQIRYLQLVETPRFESLAWKRGDTNGDGAIDYADIVTIADNFTGAQTSPPSFAKLLTDGDADGDGDVDWADAYQAAVSLARGGQGGPSRVAEPR